MGGTCLRPSHLMQRDCHWSLDSWGMQNCHCREEVRDAQGKCSKLSIPPHPQLPPCGSGPKTWAQEPPTCKDTSGHLVPGHPTTDITFGHLWCQGQTALNVSLVNKLFNGIKSLSMTIINSFNTSIFQFQIVLLWW